MSKTTRVSGIYVGGSLLGIVGVMFGVTHNQFIVAGIGVLVMLIAVFIYLWHLPPQDGSSGGGYFPSAW